MLAPVVIFVYARPDHTQRTIEALAMNSLAKNTEVYIYSDAAKNEKAIEKVNQVREYIDSLPERKLFKSLNIIKADSNNGLANSVILGVSKIIELHEKVIVVEDDLVSSSDFLEYMNEALDYYEHDNKIWSISGYTFNVKIPSDYKSEIYLSYRGCSWGWATWSNRWNKVDWEVNDYNQFKKDKKLRNNFNRGGRDMEGMLDAQMQGKIDSWAIRWCYTQSKLDMLSVYPVVSRIRNVGLDGTGTHSGISSKYDAILNDSIQKCRFDNPNLDYRIVKSFKDKFGTNFDYFVIGIKRLIKRMIRL
ncbi:sugar transferase [Paenibacillus lignilyticus]|uniref:Sugar transferase n=1 Tax=Paenibacillus lignilyticus TaxID=1172615 RepID=A0ABS5CG64_9BACL|nr:sugar transferase [Paenibacillus lignilyticus]MBP3964816.1 sugar transferase [Paenibacillus lignilyticus]